MTLDARAHQEVKRDTRSYRNTAAKGRRAASPTKAQAVTLDDATSRQDGSEALFAVSSNDPSKGYPLVQREDGGYSCACLTHRWRGTCAHSQAASGLPGK